MRLQFDPEVDYYEILQVHPKAHPEIIKRAYRTLVAQLHAHPDLGGSHEHMVALNRAYEVLSDSDLRAEYDRWRAVRAAQSADESPPAATGRPAPTAPPAQKPVAPEPAAKGGTVDAVCPNCGRRNRVPQQIGLLRARCGHCREPLLAAAHEARAQRARRSAAHRLPQSLYNELCREGQLRVQLSRITRGSRIVCRGCEGPWWAPRSGKPPQACPLCGSGEWLSFRLFKCSQCGHEFETNDMHAAPYALFPACPECGARNWNRAAERKPLRRIRRLLSRGE